MLCCPIITFTWSIHACNVIEMHLACICSKDENHLAMFWPYHDKYRLKSLSNHCMLWQFENWNLKFWIEWAVEWKLKITWVATLDHTLCGMLNLICTDSGMRYRFQFLFMKFPTPNSKFFRLALAVFQLYGMSFGDTYEAEGGKKKCRFIARVNW